ncbi:MAG: hypothetical protein AAFQ41_14010 [Cyanobacteria bacterium J06623_7]
MKNYQQWCMAAGVALLLDSLPFSYLLAAEVDLGLLCPKFPLNSRCQDYQCDLEPAELEVTRHQLNRDDFCTDYWFNSRCQQEPAETIDFNLVDEEWIRIVKTENRLQFVLAQRHEDAFVSLITEEGASFVPLPGLLDLAPFSLLDLLPLDLNRYHWQDYEITEVVFQGDRCQASCRVVGKNAVELPEQTHFSQGWFTVKYQQQELRRSVTFRLPPDVEISPIETITIEVPQ